jgi:hypothetical protein
MDDPALKGQWVPAMSPCPRERRYHGHTNTICYLTHDEIRRIPKGCTVTYARIVINHCPQKDDPNCVRITIGGNLINYPYELTIHTANMVSAKIMWNSVISTPGANLVARTSRTCISKPHLISTTTCKCPSSSFSMTSPTTTTYVRKP